MKTIEFAGKLDARTGRLGWFPIPTPTDKLLKALSRARPDA